MRPFVEEGQSVSKANQFWTHPRTWFGIATQHVALGILSKPVIRDIFLKIGMRESNEIDLPDYDFGKVVKPVGAIGKAAEGAGKFAEPKKSASVEGRS